MDLLATILTCSLYASDDAMVRAIAEGPSGNNPYLVLDPVADSAEVGARPSPKSEAEATARAKGLIAQGGRPLPHDERCGRLPEGDVFVASHFATSFDSRTFGPVPLTDIRGTVTPLWTY